MTAEEIIAKAPVSNRVGTKLAFVCVNCPWWCSDWKVPKVGVAGELHCLKCDSNLKQLPLVTLIEGTREAQSPEGWEAFLKYHATKA